MALAATTVWEIDNTGAGKAADNGGGFNASRAGAGTDYSLKANTPGAAGGPIAAPTKLAMASGSPTTLTDADAPFTAAMVGNLIYIASGTNFTVGWYEITAYASTSSVTLDRTAIATGEASSGHGHVGGCIDIPAGALLEACGPGHIVYIKGPSTYTLVGHITVAMDGTSALPIRMIGYAGTRSVQCVCDGSDRPVIAAGAYQFATDDEWEKANLVLTTTDTVGFASDAGGIFRNCKSTNSSGSDRNAFTSFACIIIDCEGISTNGSCFGIGANGRVIGCYAHDSVFGISLTASGVLVLFNIIETCATAGIRHGGNRQGIAVVHNTINSCVDGIPGLVSFQGVYLNNIISNNSSEGAVWTSPIGDNLWDYNDFYNNGTDRMNVTAGPNDNAVDPQYTGADDFSTGANVADTGFGIRLGVGA